MSSLDTVKQDSVCVLAIKPSLSRECASMVGSGNLTRDYMQIPCLMYLQMKVLSFQSLILTADGPFRLPTLHALGVLEVDRVTPWRVCGFDNISLYGALTCRFHLFTTCVDVIALPSGSLTQINRRSTKRNKDAGHKVEDSGNRFCSAVKMLLWKDLLP